MLNNFQAATKLLNCQNKKLPFHNLLDLYFIDYDLIPLLIYENYLSTFKYDNKKEMLNNLSFQTDLISESDIIDKRIRTNQNWNLLGDKGMLGRVSVCYFTKGVVPFPKSCTNAANLNLTSGVKEAHLSRANIVCSKASPSG